LHLSRTRKSLNIQKIMVYIFKRRCIIEIEKAFSSKFNELGSDYYEKII